MYFSVISFCMLVAFLKRMFWWCKHLYLHGMWRGPRVKKLSGRREVPLNPWRVNYTLRRHYRMNYVSVLLILQCGRLKSFSPVLEFKENADGRYGRYTFFQFVTLDAKRRCWQNLRRIRDVICKERQREKKSRRAIVSTERTPLWFSEGEACAPQ